LTGSATKVEFLSKLIAKAHIIINTTPLGMYPNINTCPDLPYDTFNEKQIVIDLVYNPEETLFLQKSPGVHKINGLPMLYAQAEKAWEIYGV
jgi:shikimate dehydrogenase